LIDLGVHMIDLAMWLMGDPVPVSVVGATYCKFANADAPADSEHSKFGEAKADGTFDVEDLASGFIRFSNGATLAIEFSWASNIERETYFVELRGTKAGLKWQDGNLSVYADTDGTLEDVSPRFGSPGKLGTHGANLYHFIDVVQARAQPDFKPEHGLHMIKILSAIYESAKTGREVNL
jgi:predicted dehydrogenase